MMCRWVMLLMVGTLACDHAPRRSPRDFPDVQLYRGLGKQMGLKSVRVANGFYTFSASIRELDTLRAR